MAYDRSNLTLSQIGPTSRTLLACQISTKTTDSWVPGEPRTKNETMVIELKGDVWSYISSNGVDIACEPGLAPDQLKAIQNIPLRTTPDFYVLAENHHSITDDFETTYSAMTINRSTGEYSATRYASDKKDPPQGSRRWINDDETTGHCEPTSPKF
jgi:hypothetical protein